MSLEQSLQWYEELWATGKAELPNGTTFRVTDTGNLEVTTKEGRCVELGGMERAFLSGIILTQVTDNAFYDAGLLAEEMEEEEDGGA